MDWVMSLVLSLQAAWNVDDVHIHSRTIIPASASGLPSYRPFLTNFFNRDDVKESHPITPNVAAHFAAESQPKQLDTHPKPSERTPAEFNDSPDARSKSITTAQGHDTHGVSSFIYNGQDQLLKGCH